MSWDGSWVFRAIVERLRKIIDDFEIVWEHDHRGPVRAVYDLVARYGETDIRTAPSDLFNLAARLQYADIITPHITKIANLSPSLSRDLSNALKQGWQVKFEATWRTDPEYFKHKELNIPSPEISDVTSDAARTVHHIAEQVARAQTRSISRIIARPGKDVTQEDWREAQVQKLLDARSARYLDAARVRHEIIERGGPDIDADWSDSETVTTAQALYSRIVAESTSDEHMSWDAAIKEMRDVVGREQLPLVAANVDRKTLYIHLADEFWHAAKAGTWLE